jgi:hypothetical protein
MVPNFDNRPANSALPPSVGVVNTTHASSLKVTNRDRSTATLTAMLIMVGLCVSMLFIIWVTTRVWIRNTPVAPELIEPLAGGGNAMGNARELVEPGEEEIDDFAEPQLQETIDSITDAVTDQLATLDTLGGESASTTAGGGAGDSRIAGPGDGDADLVPRWQRWQVEYNASSSQTYAKQLDAFGVELAATGGGSSTIDYVAGLSQPNPTRRSGSSADDERLYMTYQFGPLKELDARLLESVGVPTRGRILMQFYPQKAENMLALAEQEYLSSKGRSLEQVKRTTFGVTADGGNYRFFVKDQQLHR